MAAALSGATLTFDHPPPIVGPIVTLGAFQASFSPFTGRPLSAAPDLTTLAQRVIVRL